MYEGWRASLFGCGGAPGPLDAGRTRPPSPPGEGGLFDGAPGARHGRVGPRGSRERSGRGAREPELSGRDGAGAGGGRLLRRYHEPTCGFELPAGICRQSGNSRARERSSVTTTSRRGTRSSSVAARSVPGLRPGRAGSARVRPPPSRLAVRNFPTARVETGTACPRCRTGPAS